MDKKIKVLVLADSPVSATGFAMVSRNVLNRLAETGKYHFDVIGINHSGDHYDKSKYPYDIYLAQPQGSNDMYGRHRLISALNGNAIKSGLIPPYDLIFTIQDSFIIEGAGVNIAFGEYLRVTSEAWKRTVESSLWFKWIGYFPVDSDLKENWITRSIALPHYPVAYCNWGRDQMLVWDRENYNLNFKVKMEGGAEGKKGIIPIEPLKGRLSVINHGVDLDVFKPLPQEEIDQFREAFWTGQVKKDTFLVVNISRNQPRKDIPRTMQAFAEFKKRVPNSHLYLHMQVHDVGGSIDEYARYFGLKVGVDYSTPVDFSSNMGYTVDMVNKIYNAADLCITTTLGEGWGFISTEAMASKTPLIAPAITSFIDILNISNLIRPFDGSMKRLNEWLDNGGWDEVRGIPFMAGSNLSEWTCLGISDNERIRPLSNVDDMVNKMYWAYKNPEKVKEIVERGYEWVQNLAWDNIAKQWEELFDKAYSDLEKEREVGKQFKVANRNDPCPCGSGKKFKHCCAKKNMEELIEHDDQI